MYLFQNDDRSSKNYDVSSEPRSTPPYDSPPRSAKFKHISKPRSVISPTDPDPVNLSYKPDIPEEEIRPPPAPILSNPLPLKRKPPLSDPCSTDFSNYLVTPHRKRRPGFHNAPAQNTPFVPLCAPYLDDIRFLSQFLI